MPSKVPAELNKRWRRILKWLAKLAGSDAAALPGTQTEWQQVVEYIHRLQTVPLAAASVANQHPDTALDCISRQRLFTRQPNQSLEKRKTFPQQSGTSVSHSPLIKKVTAIVHWPTRNRRAGTQVTINEMVAALESVHAHCHFGSPIYAMICWMLLLYRREADDRLAHSTITDYYDTVLRSLVESGVSLELPLDAAGMQAICSYVHQQSQRRQHPFRRFLLAVEGPCNWEVPDDWQPEADASDKTGAPYIITPDDFDRARQLLSEQHYYQRQVRLIILLMFRCGLRVGEATGLLIQDIEYSAVPWLLVAPNTYRDLKGKCRPRKLPLGVLLSEGELNELRVYLGERRHQCPSDQAPLFCPQTDSSRIQSSRRVSRTIGRVLRQASGDPDVGAHHLRHAAVSWLFLALTLGDLKPASIKLVAGLTHPDFHPDRIDRLRTALLIDGTGKEILALLAKFAGHASMETTLISYLHTLPLLHSLHRIETVNAYEPELTRVLGYQDGSGIRQHYRRSGARGIYKRINKKLFAETPAGFALHDVPTSVQTSHAAASSRSSSA